MFRQVLLGSVTMWMAATCSSFAQEAPHAATATAAESDEVVVTAFKREQNLSDIGMSVQVLNADQLDSAGISDIHTLPRAVSGLTISTDREGFPSFNIRGIGFVSAQHSATPTVSVYVDEVPLPFVAMTGGVFLDVERVEVLKGPQGTLFGNNSTGGSINFIAAHPGTSFASGIELGADQFGQITTQAYAGGPITDTLGARVSFMSANNGAWQRSYTNGPKIENGEADRYAVRAIFDWTPSDTTRFSLNINHYLDQSDPTALQLRQPAPSGGPGSGFVDPVFGSVETYPLPNDARDADLTSNPTRPFVRDDDFHQVSLRSDIDLNSNLKFTAIANYAHLDTNLNRDADATRIDIIEGGHIGELETAGLELRLTGQVPSWNLNYIVGGNYARDKVHEEEPYLFNHFSILPPGMATRPVADSEANTTSVFANADWKISEQFTLTGGLRYTHAKMDYTECFANTGALSEAVWGGLAGALSGDPGTAAAYVGQPCLTVGPAPDFLPAGPSIGKSGDNSVSWRLGLNYNPAPDLLLYGLVSRGFKAGGYPFLTVIVDSEFNRVKQEELTAYELGMRYSRSRLFNVSAAAFYYDYNNKQAYALDPIPGLGPAAVLSNIPESEAYGFESELTVRPTDRLTLHAAATYTKTEINDPGTIVLDGFGAPIDLRGHPFSYTPKVSAIADVQYVMPLSGALSAVFGANANYASVSYGALDATAPFRIPAHTTADVRAGLESDHGWKLTAWVRNVTDEYYITDVNFIGDGFAATAGLPRTYGITLSADF